MDCVCLSQLSESESAHQCSLANVACGRRWVLVHDLHLSGLTETSEDILGLCVHRLLDQLRRLRREINLLHLQHDGLLAGTLVSLEHLDEQVLLLLFRVPFLHWWCLHASPWLLHLLVLTPNVRLVLTWDLPWLGRGLELRVHGWWWGHS